MQEHNYIESSLLEEIQDDQSLVCNEISQFRGCKFPVSMFSETLVNFIKTYNPQFKDYISTQTIIKAFLYYFNDHHPELCSWKDEYTRRSNFRANQEIESILQTNNYHLHLKTKREFTIKQGIDPSIFVFLKSIDQLF